ncbi:hypothetical protein AWL63_06815 [Sphingomonas panacis]|uniref:Uncharacterized protein n=1 Tax=Sphingomonas panacis TaxID=1560345 RepID=A0A1B3Z8H9_9SPHN|nr:hypothetical protein AWL63_06815 [Sphingomonas panacis]
MEAIGEIALIVGFASCVALLVALWFAKTYGLLTYLLALLVLEIALPSFLPVSQGTPAAILGALVIAAPVALLQRKARLKATKSVP